MVDDDLFVVQYLERVLSILGFPVLLAFECSQAVAQFEQRHRDLAIVLLDLCLHGPDGFIVLARLRELDPSVPVVIMSGYSDLEIKQRAAAAGAVGYLTKPFGQAEVEEALSRWGRRFASGTP